jgi:archaellum component FlaC
VYAEISGVKESVAGIQIPNIDGLKKDIKEIKTILSDMERNIAIAMKENEVQDAQIDEIKLQSKNPLGG